MEYKKTTLVEFAQFEDAQWEALLAQGKAKRLLREMAQDAREEYASGNTTAISVTDDGYLKPA